MRFHQPPYSAFGSPVMSLASSVFPSPITPPFMPQWQSTPNGYMSMPHMMTEHDMSPLLNGVTGLGLSHMTSPVPGDVQRLPPDTQIHQSRGTTYFTRKGDGQYTVDNPSPSDASTGARSAPHSSISSSHTPEDSLGQSSHASVLSPIHSREVSVETTATSNEGESLDIKTVEDSNSDGRTAASPLAGSVSSTSTRGSRANAQRPAQVPQSLTVNDTFGSRGRAATSEAVMDSPKVTLNTTRKGIHVCLLAFRQWIISHTY
jgi:hypothetical protein